MPERLRFERELNDLGLRAYEQGQAAPKPREVVVGEQVVLDVTQHPRFRFPSAGVQWAVQWTIPGTVVKSYKGDIHSARVTKLDLREHRLAFYWVDTGMGRAVKVRVTYASAAGSLVDEFVYAIFDVKAPQLDYLKAVTAKPMLVQEGGTVRLSFGNKDKQGIVWNWQVTMPPHHGGCLKDIQLVKVGRKRTKLLGSGSAGKQTLVWMHPKGHKGYQYDPPPAGSQLQRDPSKAPAALPPCAEGKQDAIYEEPLFGFKHQPGATFPYQGIHDTPSTELPQVDAACSVNEFFKYYLLFKPDKPNAIWVPIAKAEWFWRAEAFKQGAGWRGTGWNLKTSPQPIGGISKRGQKTTEFPVYESNAGENRWCTVKADGTIDCE